MNKLFVVEYSVNGEEPRPLLGEGNVVFKRHKDAFDRAAELFRVEKAFFESGNAIDDEVESFEFSVGVYERR